MKLQLNIESINPVTAEETGEKVFLVSFAHIVLSTEQIKELLQKAPTLELSIEVQ